MSKSYIVNIMGDRLKETEDEIMQETMSPLEFAVHGVLNRVKSGSLTVEEATKRVVALIQFSECPRPNVTDEELLEAIENLKKLRSIMKNLKEMK